jgi:hypothetical protein
MEKRKFSKEDKLRVIKEASETGVNVTLENLKPCAKKGSNMG